MTSYKPGSDQERAAIERGEIAPRVTFPVVAFSQPAGLDIEGYRGDSGTFRVTVTLNGGPMDVSAATFDADVRLQPDAPVLATMTVTPVAGQVDAIDVFLPAEQSAAITDTATVGTADDPNPTTPPSTEVVAVWDLEMTEAGTAGLTTTLLRGTITMTKDVSRPLPATTQDAPPDTPPPLLQQMPATEPAGAGLGPPPMLPDGTVLQRLGGPTRPPAGMPPLGPTTPPKP